jgi:hypothetical protein
MREQSGHSPRAEPLGERSGCGGADAFIPRKTTAFKGGQCCLFRPDDVSRATRFSATPFQAPWRRLAGLHPPASTPGAFPAAPSTRSSRQSDALTPPVPHQTSPLLTTTASGPHALHSYEFSAPRWHDFSSVGDGDGDGADAWFDSKKVGDPPRCTTTGPPPGAALTQLGAENLGGAHNGRLQARAGAVAACTRQSGRACVSAFLRIARVTNKSLALCF